MRRMIVLFLAIISIVFCFTGCSDDPGLGGTKDYTATTRGRLKAVPNQNDLYYDTDTRIVYIAFNEYMGNAGYGYMSPYYASNGFPYVYNPTTQHLEQING